MFKFVEAAGEFAEGLEPGAGDDDVKLVRLRTRKNELVIVPSEYLTVRDDGSESR